MVILKRSYLL